MFLRQHQRSKDGKEHGYWSLVETVRTPDGPRQRSICMEEIHATDGSRSSVSVAQERIKDSTAVPSIGTTGESARAGGVSRLRSTGDAQAPAEAKCFGSRRVAPEGRNRASSAESTITSPSPAPVAVYNGYRAPRGGAACRGSQWNSRKVTHSRHGRLM